MTIYDRDIRDGRHHAQRLTSNGEIDGPYAMNIDGSITPVAFYIQAPPEHSFYLHSMVGLLTAPGKMDSGGFGSGAALTNGIEFANRPNPQAIWTPVSAQITVKYNVDFAQFSHRLEIYAWANGDESLSFQFDPQVDGAPIRINEGEGLAVMVQDDLSLLPRFNIRVGGVMIPTRYIR